ncbi:MAG: hypothetical protein DRJ03_00430 [Chloroflexi bacterium]|nr:MAG: hypothetical protein DRJ03_00430 [Chloroflexota bacterium]
MDSKRTVVDTVDVEDKPLKLAVIRPTNKIGQEANMAYNLRMAALMRQGAQNPAKRLMLRAELEEYLAKLGVWTMDDAIEVEKLALEIRAHELMLKKGGIKVSEGRAIALQMAEKRQLIMEKHAKRQQFDSATVESQAENFRFEFLLVKCCVFADTGAPFFKNHSEYVDRQDEVAVTACAKTLANMVYGLEGNVHKNMFEMQWLKDAKMIDDDGRYIGADGVTTDRYGRLVNKDGRYINKEGQMVDTFGRPVDEHGNLLVDVSQPFIDDETGDPIVIGEIGGKPRKQTKPKAKKKRASTKKGTRKKITAKQKG